MLRKFIALSSADRWLLILSALLVGSIRLGFSVLPFRTMMRLFSAQLVEVPELPPADLAVTKKVAWSIGVASRFVPDSTCLIRALATAVLMRSRFRQFVQLRVGVAKGREGKLEAHAWVETRGRVIVGKLPDMSRYAALTFLQR